MSFTVDFSLVCKNSFMRHGEVFREKGPSTKKRAVHKKKLPYKISVLYRVGGKV
jgi:hypothetical protein